MEIAALVLGIASLIGVIIIGVIVSKKKTIEPDAIIEAKLDTIKKELESNFAQDKSRSADIRENISEISEKVVELIQKEDAEYWKIMKKIIWKDNYLAERITELEEDMKRNFKEDTERWLDEIDDDQAVYAKVMSEVRKLINETLENNQSSDSLYKRILFKLKHSPDKGPNKLKKLY